MKKDPEWIPFIIHNTYQNQNYLPFLFNLTTHIPIPTITSKLLNFPSIPLTSLPQTLLSYIHSSHPLHPQNSIPSLPPFPCTISINSHLFPTYHPIFYTIIIISFLPPNLPYPPILPLLPQSHHLPSSSIPLTIHSPSQPTSHPSINQTPLLPIPSTSPLPFHALCTSPTIIPNPYPPV
jgi:hypothetical protein